MRGKNVCRGILLVALGLLFSCSDQPTYPPGMSQNGYYEITFPTDSTVASIGQGLEIFWKSSSIASELVSIYLCKDSLLTEALAVGTDNDGACFCSLSGDTGSHYRIKIADYYNSSHYDFSSFFRIVSIYHGSITVTSPLSGSSYVYNNSVPISWTDSGYLGSYSNIYLFKDTTLAATITTETYDNGTFTWSPANAALGTSSRYRIKVASYDDTSIYGFSDYFSITSQYYGGYTITSPLNGATLNAGSSCAISWSDSGQPGSYLTIKLLGESGITTISSDSYDYRSYAWTIPAATTSGTYRIIIQSFYNPAVSDTGAPFTIKGVAKDSYEPDNSQATAASISLDTSWQQHTLTLYDTDWVKFPAKSGNSYIIRCSGAVGTTLFLYDSLGTSYLSYFSNLSTIGDSHLRWKCMASGTYYVRTTAYSAGSAGSYSINIREIDSTTVLTVTSPTASAVWQVDSTYQVTWKVDTTFFGRYLDIDLMRGADSVQELYTAMNAFTDTFSWLLPFNLGTGTNYRIRLRTYLPSATIPVFTSYSDSFKIAGTDPDRYEPDNQMADAKPITRDSVQSRSLTVSDTDWISFQATKDSIYTVFVNSSFSMIVNLLDDQGKNLGSATGSTPELSATCSKSGTYYIEVRSVYPVAGGYYTVKLTEKSTVRTLTFVNPIASTVLTSGTSYSIQWLNNDSLLNNFLNLYLYKDSTLVAIAGSDITTTSGSFTYSWTPSSCLVTGSDYRLQVTNSAKTITGYSPFFTISGITPDTFENDNNITQARTIALDGKPQAHTLSQGDHDWLTFHGAKNNLYVIRAQGTASPTLSLLSTDGSTVLSSFNPLNVDSCDSALFFSPADTTYYLNLFSTKCGSYSLSVTRYDTTDFQYTISAPGAAAVLHDDATYLVEWTSTYLVEGNVDILLYDSTGLVMTIDADIPNIGQYVWKIPINLPAGDQYYIEITNRSNSLVYGKSAIFTMNLQ